MGVREGVFQAVELIRTVLRQLSSGKRSLSNWDCDLFFREGDRDHLEDDCSILEQSGERILMKSPQGSEEFIAEQKKILSENPECASSSYNLGVSLIQQGKFDEAIDAFNESIANSGRMFEAYVNLGYIFFKKGELDKVVDANSKAVEIEPRYARGYANLGFAYLQMARTEDAIEALEKAIDLNSGIVQAWSNLVNAHLQNDDIETAIETGEKMLEIAPDFALGHNNLASAYYNNGDYDKAIEHLDKAVSLGFEPHPEFLERLKAYR